MKLAPNYFNMARAIKKCKACGLYPRLVHPNGRRERFCTGCYMDWECLKHCAFDYIDMAKEHLKRRIPYRPIFRAFLKDFIYAQRSGGAIQWIDITE